MLRLAGLWAPSVGFMAAVWFLSDSLSSRTPDLVSDKILHLLAYALFGVANFRAFQGGFRRPGPWATVAALLLTVGFGALDESRQSDVSCRDASWEDWVADVGGALAAWLTARFFPRDGGQTKIERKRGND